MQSKGEDDRMSHEEYLDYLYALSDEIIDYLCRVRGIHNDLILREEYLLWFDKASSSYHYWLHNQRVFQKKENEDWLENRAVVGTGSPPPKQPGGSPSTRQQTQERALEVREFVRANVNDKEHKHLTKSAKNALLMLLDGDMLDQVSDYALVQWHENWVEKVKL